MSVIVAYLGISKQNSYIIHCPFLEDISFVTIVFYIHSVLRIPIQNFLQSYELIYLFTYKSIIPIPPSMKYEFFIVSWVYTCL